MGTKLTRMPTIAAAAQAFRAGDFSPRDLVELCVERIASSEPQLRAWETLDLEAAQAAADQATDELRRGVDRGPLHGVPIGVKDLIDVAGLPTRAGSPLRRAHRADADAPLVARLRSAGAILLGKTVTTEFACFDPAPTYNPWRHDRTPGGSSSGSAATVAARVCPAALGSQTGGSIIRPASFCGIAGFKPTFGRVSLVGVVPVAQHLDHVGPMATTVSDLALVFAAIDERPGSREKRFTVDDPPVAQAVRFVTFQEHFDELADDEVRRTFREALARLRAAGATIESVDVRYGWAEVVRSHRVIMAVEAAQVHAVDFARHADQYGPHVGSLIREGLELRKQEAATGAYAAALRHQREASERFDGWLGPQTVVLTPSTVTPPPGRETTGDPRFNSPWSFLGAPSATLPSGLSDEGTPCGLQLIGVRDSDQTLLQTAAWCERALDFHGRPPNSCERDLS